MVAGGLRDDAGTTTPPVKVRVCREVDAVSGAHASDAVRSVFRVTALWQFAMPGGLLLGAATSGMSSVT